MFRLSSRLLSAPVSLRRSNAVSSAFACLALLAGAGPGRTAPPLATSKSPSADGKTTKSAPSGPLRGSDIMATVDGQPITRRELTEFWIKIDLQTARPLGNLIANRLRSTGKLSPAYTVTENDLYETLFHTSKLEYAIYLSNMVTTRLIAQEAKKRGVVVTSAEAEKMGHALMEQVRHDQHVQMSDADILEKFHVPRDIVFEEMAFRLRGERLFAAEMARKNGHPVGVNDWIALRQLFAGANLGTDKTKNEKEFADARARVEGWAAEVRKGKRFEDMAGAYNEDETRGSGGARGVSLRGTGTKTIEDAVFALKPGEISAPLRGRDGWYVFLVERKGSQISAGERDAAWKEVLARRLTPFLADIRKHAKITSVVALPVDTLSNPRAPEKAAGAISKQ